MNSTNPWPSSIPDSIGRWAYPNLAWLEKHQEKIVEPELEIIDAHHHLRDYDERANRARYLFHDLLGDITCGHNIVGSVCVETRAMYRADGPPEMRPVGETEFVNGIAAMSASGNYTRARLCTGIVGNADLSLGDRVAAVLEGHLTASRARFRGIRQSSAWHASDTIPPHGTRPPKGLLLSASFREGFARLHEFQLSFDSYIYHSQMAEVEDLARAFPNTTIILNHMGTPLAIGVYENDKAPVFDEWRKAIYSLAKCPNVVIKIGGIGMQFSGFDYPFQAIPPSSSILVEHWRAYVESCIDAFRPDRCMFESNFPTDKVSFSYHVLWNAFKLLTSGYSTDEKKALFAGTARRVYRLGI